MNQNFTQMEDVIADQRFMAWHLGASSAEAIEWQTLMQHSPQLQQWSTDASAFLRGLPADQPLTPQQIEASLVSLKKKLQQAPVISMPRRSKKIGWMIAASVALLIVAGTFFLTRGSANDPIVSHYGQLSTNCLPDGSTVILNANSNMKLSKGWDAGNDREVWLEGEAFFKVAKTEEKTRFIVHTGQLDVIVTGTQFNVLHRDKKTSVLLTEGSVTIRTPDGKETMMKPGDFVEMNDTRIERKTVKEDNILAWKDNRMAFDDTPFDEVAKIISNHYGVKVTLADQTVRNQSLFGIMKNNNLDELLQAIEWSSSVKVERKEKEIIISSNRQ